MVNVWQINPPIRVIVAGGRRPQHVALRGMLEPEGFEVVACLRRDTRVLPLVERERPDAVLHELDFPSRDGLTLIRHLRERHPEIVSVVLAASAREEDVRAAFEHGARGYIVTTQDPDRLASTLRALLRDGTEQAAPGPGATRRGGGVAGLTPRELQVLVRVASGRSNDAIARDLLVSSQTVMFHVANICRKLGVTDRTAAARVAFELGVAGLPEWPIGCGDPADS